VSKFLEREYQLVIWDWFGTLCKHGQVNPDSLYDQFPKAAKGIISNHKYSTDLEKWLKDTNLITIFGGNYICQDGRYPPKPNPHMYFRLLKLMELRVDLRILYIGDSDTDEEFAKNIGADFMSIS